jgi:Ni/Co efflux regulator RcnB
MMKKKKFTVAALALATVVTAGLPTAAAAQDWRRDRDRDGRYERWERREDRQDRREYRQWSRERDRWERQNDRYERQQRREYRRWARGQTIPHHYRSNWYIRDYQRYGYRAPPRGYGYYRTDSGDVVLAALATGVILSLLN